MRLVSVVTSTRWSLSHAPADLVHEVVDLAVGGPDLDHGIDEPGGADDLLDDVDAVGQLELAGRGGDEDELRHLLEELVEAQRPVVEGAGQAEAVLDQLLLARLCRRRTWRGSAAATCATRRRTEEVVREVVEQAVGRGARLLAEQDARVVLDAAAVAHLAQHLHVVLRALAQALGLEELAVLLEPGAALLHLPADLDERALDGRVVGDEVRGRIDGDVLGLLDDLAADRGRC